MDDIIIRRAVASDAVELNRALGQLSADMGDQHRAGDGDIARFCFGPEPVFHALLAVGQNGSIVGASAYSPFFSTVYGGAGVYVSDLWVDAQTRGKRLGQRLLAAVRDEGIRMWDARLMRLNVYHDNPKALAFYERIGFVAVSDAQYLTLSGAAFETLGEQT
jgi:ribosomal protein S18 acetylase RimI-like enzyme